MRRLVLVAALSLLAACASEEGSTDNVPLNLPQWFTGLPGGAVEFGVSRVGPGDLPEGYDQSNNQSPDLNTLKAAQICTRGYELFGVAPAPGTPVALEVARVRCNLYRPSL
jgi:hypothetical protein